MRLKTLRFIALAAMVGACSGDDADTGGGEDTGGEKNDQISGNDDPSGLLQNAERRLLSLISNADVGKQFIVPDDSLPYPDTYWPMVDNGIAQNWLNKDGSHCDLVPSLPEQGGGSVVHQCDDPAPSPLEKWMNLINPGDTADAIQWEKENHGKLRDGVLDWFGHCPGWVATSLLNPPVPAPIHVSFNGSSLSKCTPGSAGCVKFEIGDINALGAEAHEGAASNFIGARCDTLPSEIERDEFGRIVRNGSGCKGLNAGAMLIVLGNQIKINKKPFAIDAQNEFNTEQIWNQPAFGYTVNKLNVLDERSAANLVASGGESTSGNLTDYIFNTKANGFVFIDFTLHWVTEAGPNTEPLVGTDSPNQTRMVAVIELDGPPNNPNTKIIGGEYLDDESVGANRLRNAPFVWVALDHGRDNQHNPFLQADLVQQLLDLATAQ